MQYVRVLSLHTTLYQDHYFAWLPSSLQHQVFFFVVYNNILISQHKFVVSYSKQIDRDWKICYVQYYCHVIYKKYIANVFYWRGFNLIQTFLFTNDHNLFLFIIECLMYPISSFKTRSFTVESFNRVETYIEGIPR